MLKHLTFNQGCYRVYSPTQRPRLEKDADSKETVIGYIVAPVLGKQEGVG